VFRGGWVEEENRARLDREDEATKSDGLRSFEELKLSMLSTGVETPERLLFSFGNYVY
jgi:hypothetical protein